MATKLETSTAYEGTTFVQLSPARVRDFPQTEIEQARCLNRCGKAMCEMARKVSRVLEEMESEKSLESKRHIPKIRDSMEKTLGENGEVEKIIADASPSVRTKQLKAFIDHEMRGNTMRYFRQFLSKLDESKTTGDAQEQMQYLNITFKGFCKNVGVLTNMRRFSYDEELGVLNATSSLGANQRVYNPKTQKTDDVKTSEVTSSRHIRYDVFKNRWEHAGGG